MNAVLLADDLKVALRVKVNNKGLVGHKDIASYVRERPLKVDANGEPSASTLGVDADSPSLASTFSGR
ncbi:hypothetical protein FH972_012788 [Carpinus fangiana]|uniref:Uncharacterized protein n=1 Tax=Carpinus fangiana TaxID=176857 RepID=A0A5N6R781_9ROSI|nr:hypothetical protein FH972_012788 [Carpinus fangiana]